MSRDELGCLSWGLIVSMNFIAAISQNPSVQSLAIICDTVLALIALYLRYRSQIPDTEKPDLEPPAKKKK